MNAKAIREEYKRIVADFIKDLDISPTFINLRIIGLHKIVSSGDLSHKNKLTIFQFLNHVSAEVSEHRLTFYAHKLRKLAEWLKKDFSDVSEQDLRSLITFLSKGSAKENGEVFSKGTLHGYKVALKRFYRWLEGDDEDYPRKVRWLKSSGDATRIKEPEQLLNHEEILEMIRCAKNPRDKAIISFLYESGARVSEMMSMKIKS